MTERTGPSAWGWLSGLPGSLLGGMQRAAADVLPVRIGGTALIDCNVEERWNDHPAECRGNRQGRLARL